MYKLIRNISLLLAFPLLLGSTNLETTKIDIRNNRDYYEVIGATTGRKIEKQLYTEERLIKTHITSVSAIKKALANEGIDPANIRVLLYYDGLTISDSAPARMWQNKAHPNTISSPWLDLTKTITTSGESRITVRVDATIARLLNDLYSENQDKSKTNDFLSISSIKENCYLKVISEYEKYGLNEELAVDKARKIYSCVPGKLKEPLLALFQSSPLTNIHDHSFFDWSVYLQLYLHCQDEAEGYYSELFPRLAVEGLKEIEDKPNYNPKWWTEIIDRTKPIQECKEHSEKI